ncbi:hypothetical protein MED134_07054 [Dokdonia sp. MED134]|uniref:ATP-dependent nuclease n=1 Tax=Dokdonia sp. MED134 TaxID=313590 RepID=UPI000068AA40|nr:AAA family ATPase [Dokdonia sp. MED134]EAQ40494.1 hypothetical protein MED134_07054 [Dokdonia sp. MED134]
MRLHRIKIQGFRRLKDVDITFGDATFLIGHNNVGKSSVLKAIGILLSGSKTLDSSEYYSELDEESGESIPIAKKIVLEAEFRNVPIEAKTWRGFKGRILNYESEDETGLSLVYKRTYPIGGTAIPELQTKVRTLKEEFKKCVTWQDYIDVGVPQEVVEGESDDLTKKVGKSAKALKSLENFDEIWDVSNELAWVTNPGGIMPIVINKLPRYLLIPIDTSIAELQGSGTGVLSKTLKSLFDTVRDKSDNFLEAQKHLKLLSDEMDPNDEGSEFGKMMIELNSVLSSVFPDTALHASTDLSNPISSIRPTFNVEMSSNIRTSIENQGTGMVRAAVFGMLRFRQQWLSRHEDAQDRSLIICFEEPEIYLHPSAANQMRDAIYELSDSNSQIIASTHSPYLIDIARKPKQVLNRLSLVDESVNNTPFSVSEGFKKLQDDDKTYVKMLLKIDDYISRVFYTETVVIVEGDTEDIILRESLDCLPKEVKHRITSNFEIVKARGKATIIGLVKYLISMGIHPIVIHDRDKGTPGAEKFNNPILEATQGYGKVIILEENIEDVLDYKANSEKPFKAYEYVSKWETKWENIPQNWKNILLDVFEGYI